MITAVRQNKLGTGFIVAIVLVLMAAAAYGIYGFLTRTRTRSVPGYFRHQSDRYWRRGSRRDLSGRQIHSESDAEERLGKFVAEECSHQQQYSGATARRRLLQRPALFPGRKLFLFCAQRSGKSGVEIFVPFARCLVVLRRNLRKMWIRISLFLRTAKKSPSCDMTIPSRANIC